MKKFLAMLLSFVMLLTLTMPAMAAEGDTDPKTEGDVTATYTPKYAINIAPCENGTVISDKQTAQAGETVTLAVTPNSGYTLESLSVVDANNTTVTVTDNAFTMPEAAVTVTATFKAPTKYQITVNSTAIENGTIEAPASAAAGEIVSLTVSLHDGYALDSITVTDANGGNVTVTNHQFTMPASNVTISATFTIATSHYDITVSDVENGSVSVSPVQDNYDKGTTITLTVTPSEGYVLDTLTVNSGDVAVTKVNDTTYTFVMPEANVTVSAAFRKPAAEITGVTITIDGIVYSSSNTSVQNPAVITKDTQSITLTVSGKDFALLTDSYYVGYASGVSIPITEDYVFEIDTANNIATKDFSENVSDFQNSTEAFEIYYNNNSAEDTYSGLYIIYQDNTVYNITVTDSTNGTVTATPTSAKAGETVTLTWTTADGYALEKITVTDGSGYELSVEQDLTKATFTMPASDVTVTATFYAMPISSVEITWGSMAFTYTNDNGWTNDSTSEGAGTVTVKNAGDTTLDVGLAYTAESDYSEIEGLFLENVEDAAYDVGSTKKENLAANASVTYTFELQGQPEKAITAGTKIGVITVTIKDSSEVDVPSENT